MTEDLAALIAAKKEELAPFWAEQDRRDRLVDVCILSTGSLARDQARLGLCWRLFVDAFAREVVPLLDRLAEAASGAQRGFEALRASLARSPGSNGPDRRQTRATPTPGRPDPRKPRAVFTRRR